MTDEIRIGTNARVTKKPSGFLISGHPGNRRFSHPWKPSLSARGARIAPGRVSGFEPTINNVPLSGDEKHAPPVLPLDFKIAVENESWVCLEVTPADPPVNGGNGSDGNGGGGNGGSPFSPGGGDSGGGGASGSWDEPITDIPANAPPSARPLVEIVHRSAPFSTDKKTGRQPLALVLWKDKRATRVVPQCFFNLRYVRLQPPSGSGPTRHFFL